MSGHQPVGRCPDASSETGTWENLMSDDKSKRGVQDRKLIRLTEDYEVRDWSEKFGVTADELRAAVQKVGNKPEDVLRELRGS